MLLSNEREETVIFGKKLADSNFVVGTSGNISIFDRKSSCMVITPSGRPYHELMAKDIVVLDLQGNLLEGEGKPSSEWRMHAGIYAERTDISAIVHTHSPNATSLASMEMDLPAFYYLMALAGGTVRCAPYATFGSPELAESARVAMDERNAVLLARHGMLAGAGLLEKAFSLAMHIENISGVYLKCLAAGKDPTPLPDDEIERLKVAFKVYKP